MNENKIKNKSQKVEWESSKDIFATNKPWIYRASLYMGYASFLCFFRKTEKCFGRAVGSKTHKVHKNVNFMFKPKVEPFLPEQLIFDVWTSVWPWPIIKCLTISNHLRALRGDLCPWGGTQRYEVGIELWGGTSKLWGWAQISAVGLRALRWDWEFWGWT